VLLIIAISTIRQVSTKFVFEKDGSLATGQQDALFFWH